VSAESAFFFFGIGPAYTIGSDISSYREISRVGDSGITSETHTSGCFKHTRRVVCIVPIWHPYRASQYCLCLECLRIVLYMVPQCIECIEYCYTLLMDDYIVLSYSGAPNS
jgi:hypothetical protein